MTKFLRTYAMAMILIVAMGVAMAGCVSSPPPATPTIKIISPQNGATLPAGNVTVTVQVSNLNIVDKQGQANVAGEGHVHFYMDVSPIPGTPGQPAIPPNANAIWAHVSGTTYTFTNVPAGTHTFAVQLVNNDHTPITPLVTDSVTVTVTAPAGNPAITITSPQNGASLPAGNITVTTQVTNFNVVDKQGQANVAGQGHVHFYLDVSPIPGTPGQPAIPPNANAIWAHISGTTYTFTNVPSGTHTIAVQLVNNDHTPITPLVTDSVTVTVTGPQTTVSQTTAPPTTMATTTSASGGQTVQMTLTAKNIAFDKSTLTAPAGSKVVMTFVNQDSGVPHNFALYTDSSATTRLFAGSFVTGPTTTTYTFTVPSTPGNYFFRCDVHPTVMYGTFVVT